VTGDQPGEGFVAPAEDLVRAFWHGGHGGGGAGRPHDADVRLVARAVVSASGAQTTGMDDEQERRSRRLLRDEWSTLRAPSPAAASLPLGAPKRRFPGVGAGARTLPGAGLSASDAGGRLSWRVGEVELAAPGGDLLGWDAGAARVFAGRAGWVGEQLVVVD
jgi:hypothetical protein